ncbi:helix-turn-helix domain-containing protein [Nisaea sp.]|uniref:winged helix-turn-helix transcriptional regulator n=3 Tax=Nisaea sp. TaxID=2024842 RepID=UPI003263B4CC
MEKNRQYIPDGAPATISEHLMRGDLMAVACPSRDVMRHITSRWGVLALIVLMDKTRRFSEIRRTINGVSERMLSQTLSQLEQDGLVKRVAYPVVPPHVEYSLTPIGREAAEKVQDLADWVELNMQRLVEARPSPDSKT